MPDQALLYFSKELERYNGTFVLRGIPENSFSKLFQKLDHLRSMGVHAPFSIDPDLFEKHASKAVPTLLLKGEKQVDRIVGNLSIRDSLERFSLSGFNRALAKQKLKEERDG
jgi:type-F conjugative transfer system pilin assembly protein TrbC